jgi:Carbohydrate binding domain
MPREDGIAHRGAALTVLLLAVVLGLMAFPARGQCRANPTGSTDTGLSPGPRYTDQVRASHHPSASKESNQTSITTLAEPAAGLRYRWVFISYNLLVDTNVQTVLDIMRRAKAAGYNGIVLADYRLQLLDQMPPIYLKNAAVVKQAAMDLGLEIYPAVCPIGYSRSVLAHDPNQAEGLPVRDALFVVHKGQADLVADPPAGLKNGDFEQAQNGPFSGWEFQDFPGAVTFADREVHHGGSQSLRMENIGSVGNARVMQTVRVAPYRQYHLSAWIKTRDFETPGNVQALVLTPAGRSLTYTAWPIQSTQDWTQYHVVFNSLDDTQLRVYLGVWDGGGGTIWWDDAQLEEVGLLNVLRRDGCPLVVKGEDGTVYREGSDFSSVEDKRLGIVPSPGEYEIYHPAPPIQLAAGSRLQEGQRLRVSFYHPVTIYDGQVTCCLSEPKVYSILNDQITGINQLLHPPGFFMCHDELRVANWCEACQSRQLTPGQLLGDNVSRCVQMIRAASPKAQIFVWSDMFDPFHNAHDDYYLVNGTLANSWDGLPRDVVVVDWYFDIRKQTMPWFAQHGYSQVLAGYYDGSPEQIHTWLDDASGVANVVGVMYTTWANQYGDLEAFAKAAWGP